jgi:hypothetical protein
MKIHGHTVAPEARAMEYDAAKTWRYGFMHVWANARGVFMGGLCGRDTDMCFDTDLELACVKTILGYAWHAHCTYRDAAVFAEYEDQRVTGRHKA